MLPKPKLLPNGLTLTYIDESKKIAEDRWQIKIRSVASLPLNETMRAALHELSPEEQEFIHNELADVLRYEQIWERQFVDHDLKEQVIAEELERSTKLFPYLGQADFAAKLFKQRLSELRQAFKQRPLSQDTASTIPEPDDFSACFKN
ncbi:MAG TPA: hypothetical protein ENK33_11205 [Desulfobacterales bacterium]|nr:hypothetical protein [Desulfobacterales bacterium]